MSISGPDLATALNAVIRGELDSMGLILAADHGDILKAADVLGTQLVVPRTAPISVVRGLVNGAVAPELAQQWASFLSAGFVANRSTGPIRAVEIEFEAAWEDAISSAVSRLEEIGDLIDGEVTTGEALDLLRLLGEP